IVGVSVPDEPFDSRDLGVELLVKALSEPYRRSHESLAGRRDLLLDLGEQGVAVAETRLRGALELCAQALNLGSDFGFEESCRAHVAPTARSRPLSTASSRRTEALNSGSATSRTPRTRRAASAQAARASSASPATPCSTATRARSMAAASVVC